MNNNKFVQKNMNENRNKHIAMHPCTEFQVIWGNSDFGTNFATKI